MKIYKQLADFQQEVPAIHKDTEGYGYSYANLTSILDVINPLLAKHSLGFTQIMEGTGLRTIVFSTIADEKIEGFAEIPQGITLAKMNSFQVAGSAITYYRRYALSAMLGLVTDVDNDADGFETTGMEKKVSEKREIASSGKTFKEQAIAYKEKTINIDEI